MKTTTSVLDKYLEPKVLPTIKRDQVIYLSYTVGDFAKYLQSEFKEDFFALTAMEQREILILREDTENFLGGDFEIGDYEEETFEDFEDAVETFTFKKFFKDLKGRATERILEKIRSMDV